MRYPKWNNYCTLKRKDDEVKITNHILEETFTLPIEIVRFGKKLDGKTNPYSIDKRLNRSMVCDLLKTLDALGCIRQSRVLSKSIGSILFSLYIPNKISPYMRIFAWFYNKALQISFLPMLIFGISYFSNSSETGDGGMYIGIILGFVSGIILHETSHALAALSCPKGRFFEMGIGISYFIMPIAYALVDVRQVKNRFQRVQVNLAGIETNIFLCGLFLLLAGLCGSTFWEMFLGAAIQNGFLGLLNLVFSNGIDGANAMAELMGDRSNTFISKSRKLIFNKKERQRVLSIGINGYAIVTSAYVFQLLQLTIPALYIWNVLSFI